MDGPPRDLKKRTKEFALRVIRLVASLPRSMEAQVIGRQLLRSGTAVGANFREALRSRSKSEYAAKMNIGLMELEESCYWLELLEEAAVVKSPETAALQLEANELSAIFVTMIRKAREGAAKGL